MQQRIKAKIEAAGKPLKEWDISIYRGILTGCNEAFIIDGEKRRELLEKSPKNAEVIRPILRGRDIKRYGYQFADLWLICTFPSLKIDIEQYPDVKNHLLSYGLERLEQTGKTYNKEGKTIKSRKKTNNKWFETSDSIAYWEEFFRQKIVWNRIAKEKQFSLVEKGIFIQDSMHFFTGKHLNYLCATLNSQLFKWMLCLIIGEAVGGNAGNASNVSELYIPIPTKELETEIEGLLESEEYTKIDERIYEMYNLTTTEIAEIEGSL